MGSRICQLQKISRRKKEIEREREREKQERKDALLSTTYKGSKNHMPPARRKCPSARKDLASLQFFMNNFENVQLAFDRAN